MSRNACNGETGEKSPASGDLNWMPKVAPWRLAILAKLVILAKIAMHAMAKLTKNNQPLAIFELDGKSGPLEAGDMWQNIQIACQKWPLQSR